MHISKTIIVNPRRKLHRSAARDLLES